MARFSYVYALIILIMGAFGSFYMAFYANTENLKEKLTKRDWQIYEQNGVINTLDYQVYYYKGAYKRCQGREGKR